VFDRVVLHGTAATLVWGYRPVAVLTSWRIAQTPDGWRLVGRLARAADAWQVSQAVKCRELVFTAWERGQWRFALTDVNVGTTELRALVGPV